MVVGDIMYAGKYSGLSTLHIGLDGMLQRFDALVWRLPLHDGNSVFVLDALNCMTLTTV